MSSELGPTSDGAEAVVDSVTVTAPVRVADVGGWTDTWFAPRGAVCHLGVGPGIEVRAELYEGEPSSKPVRIIAADLGEDYACGPSSDAGWADPRPGRHPLLEHAVASVCERLTLQGPVRLRIHAAVPPGASLGTSASVVVATIAALEALLGGPDAVATTQSDAGRQRLAGLAHRVETQRAGRQAGVQDQWAAVFGGAQLLTIDDYPEAKRRPIRLTPTTLDLLGETMVTVGVGRHDSSAVHHEVIEAVTSSGDAGAQRRAVLEEMTDLAHAAAEALDRGDLSDWAAVLTRATDAQIRLHPQLLGPAHRAVIAIARRREATGWKVNGAGGSGGSVTAVFGSSDAADRFRSLVASTDTAWSVFDLRPWPGVTVEPAR